MGRERECKRIRRMLRNAVKGGATTAENAALYYREWKRGSSNSWFAKKK